MLIKCKECGLQISDKAVFCPHCGLPIKPNQIHKISKIKKLPNGFGQITKLKNSKLRKPYRAMICVGKTPQGRPISKLLKPTAYFATYNEAYNALVENAKSPYEKMKDSTLETVWLEWQKDAFTNISQSTILQYQNAWKYLIKYKDLKISEIKPKQIKDWINDPNLPRTIPHLIKILLNQLFDYAVENEIVEKNYSRISVINRDLKDTKNTKHHLTFTQEEISVLWQHKADPTCRRILIQCYAGLRPDELCNILIENINLSENYMIGGMKTENGKDRIIPIHSAIKTLIIKEINISKRLGVLTMLSSEKKKSSLNYRMYWYAFKDTMKELGLNSEHSPHDPRKFFISEAKKYQLDEYAIKRIVGHSITDITEAIYTERDAQWLISEIEKIKVCSG